MFHYQFQSDLANGVCAFNLFMVGPLTMKFGTLISVHQNKFSSKQVSTSVKLDTLMYFGGERNMCSY